MVENDGFHHFSELSSHLATKSTLKLIQNLLGQAYPDKLSITDRTIENSLGNPYYVHFVIHTDEQLLAYAQFQLLFGEAELFNIAVDPDYQGQGIGQKLLSESIKVLEKMDMYQCILEVRESNQSARYLYEKHDFKQIDIREKYYEIGQEDAVIYRWKKENT